MSSLIIRASNASVAQADLLGSVVAEYERLLKGEREQVQALGAAVSGILDNQTTIRHLVGSVVAQLQVTESKLREKRELEKVLATSEQELFCGRLVSALLNLPWTIPPNPTPAAGKSGDHLKPPTSADSTRSG